MNEFRIRQESFERAKTTRSIHRRSGFLTWETFEEIINDIWHALSMLYQRMENMADATQADIDAITATVQQVESDLSGVAGNLQKEIDSLSNLGVNVDGLRAALAPLDAQVQALGSIQPTQPAQAPVEAPPSDVTPTEPAPTPVQEQPPVDVVVDTGTEDIPPPPSESV